MSLFRANEPSGVRVNTRSGAKEVPYTGPAWWVTGLALAIALLAQVELAHFVNVRGGQPSLVLVLVVWYALHADWRRAAIFGLLAGACEDALGAQTGASWTIATTATAIFANTLARWFMPDSLAVAALVAFACTLLRRMLFWVMMALTMNYPPGYARVHFHQAVWSSLLNAVLIVVGMLLRRRYEARALRT
ncbi:MAG TPA: rod shape-determining protein MreD [Candidatus Baltobacteraceae bacterium]|nr:rod shape-determining protein MreD [Candidatus Baltobacteraceae bacterium]